MGRLETTGYAKDKQAKRTSRQVNESVMGEPVALFNNPRTPLNLVSGFSVMASFHAWLPH